MKLSQVYEGWRNKLVPPAHLKKEIELAVKDRMKICKDCENHSENAKKKGYATLRKDAHCTNCGCTLSAKTACLSCECPVNKWEAVLSQEQQTEIENDGRKKR